MKGAQGKEKGFMIAGAICIFLMMIPLFMITFSVGIIPNLILMLIFCGLGITFMMLANKERKARLNGTNNTQVKQTNEKQTSSVNAESKAVLKPVSSVDENSNKVILKPVENASDLKNDEVVFKGELKPNNSYDDPFEQALNKKKDNDSTKTVENGNNKKILTVIIPIITILVTAIIAVIVVLALNKKENKDNGGNGGGGSSKVTFNITTETYFEEYSGDYRVDGYVFKPNCEYIQYRFEKFDEGFFVTWIEYGTWTYNESTSMVHATCTTYETYDSYTDTWKTNTYPEGASNSLKDFKVVSDKKLYWNGNSEFKIDKVTSFKYQIKKYHA